MPQTLAQRLTELNATSGLVELDGFRTRYELRGDYVALDRTNSKLRSNQAVHPTQPGQTQVEVTCFDNSLYNATAVFFAIQPLDLSK